MRFLLICFSLFVFGLGYAQTDTLNQTDANGKKQGYWKIYGKDKKNSIYCDSCIVEKGQYLESRKSGVWKNFYPSGKLKSEIEYKNNRPNGLFKLYYENGIVEEEGTFKAMKYVGLFKRYFENGCIAQKKDFGLDGKVIWYIYYFPEFPCGSKKEMEWNIDSNGMLYMYNLSGDTLKKEKQFQKTQPDPHRVPYTPGGDPELEFKKKDTSKINPLPDEYFKLYDEQKRITHDGVFKNGKLWNGKHYIYDKDGILLKIEIYKNGKYFGDGQLD